VKSFFFHLFYFEVASEGYDLVTFQNTVDLRKKKDIKPTTGTSKEDLTERLGKIICNFKILF
jgi:hypothetical protein